MKEVIVSLLVLSFAGSAIAAQTYTEQMVNKWVAPVSQKERQLQRQQAAAERAKKQREMEQQRREQERQRMQKQRQREMEAAKRAHQNKMEEKKKALDTLLGK